MKTIHIYTLAHPVTGEIRYVGKTGNLSQRYSIHTTSLSRRNRTCNWIKSLKRQGLKPVMEVLDQVPEEEWIQAEQYWIAQFRQWGFNLTNLTAGGEGACGYVPPHTQTEWFKELASSIHKGKKLSLETRQRITVSLTGKKKLMDTKQKIGQKNILAQERRSTRVLHVFKSTGQFLGTFRTGNGLARALGYPVSTIQMYLTGRNKSVRDLIIHVINCEPI